MRHKIRWKIQHPLNLKVCNMSKMIAAAVVVLSLSSIARCLSKSVQIANQITSIANRILNKGNMSILQD